jgi:hypothetical protein
LTIPVPAHPAAEADEMPRTPMQRLEHECTSFNSGLSNNSLSFQAGWLVELIGIEPARHCRVRLERAREVSSIAQRGVGFQAYRWISFDCPRLAIASG